MGRGDADGNDVVAICDHFDPVGNPLSSLALFWVFHHPLMLLVPAIAGSRNAYGTMCCDNGVLAATGSFAGEVVKNSLAWQHLVVWRQHGCWSTRSWIFKTAGLPCVGQQSCRFPESQASVVLVNKVVDFQNTTVPFGLPLCWSAELRFSKLTVFSSCPFRPSLDDS
jgi:hypothetical protein